MENYNTEKTPNFCEIERRLGKAKERLKAKEYSKAEGCINALWHRITELAEELESKRRCLEYDIETVRRNAYKDSYNVDENEMQSAVDSIVRRVADLKDILITRRAYALENKFSSEALSEAWGEYLKHAERETRKEYEEGWRKAGMSEAKIKTEIAYWMHSYPPYLPGGTVARVESKSVDIVNPIKDRGMRDNFASIDKDAGNFLTKYFDFPCHISYDYLY